MTSTQSTQARPARTLTKHSTDMVSLISGAIFLGVTGTWALERADVLSGVRGWLLPLLLIGVGVIGLIGIRPRRRTDTSGEEARSDWSAGGTTNPSTTQPSTTEPSTTQPSTTEPSTIQKPTDA